MRVPINWLKEYVAVKVGPKELADRLTLVGHALDKAIYEQGEDTIIDLEDRGNRSDAMGILGVARETAAVFDLKLEYPKIGPIPRVDNSKFKPQIKVASDRVIRWEAVCFKNVRVRPSPDYIQQKLRSYGIEVVNNVVDITNFVMIETGMPTHAFDVDKFKGITLRTAKLGETLVTFDGTNLVFDNNDLLAADGDTPLTLTTAVGGRESGVSEETRNVLFEAGVYDQPTARRSALRLNIHNESGVRLGKYLHPDYCQLAIARIIRLMEEQHMVSPEPVSYDYYPRPYPKVTVTLSQNRLDTLAGSHISLEESCKILNRLEFKVISQTRVSLTVEVPYWRTDVTMEDDLVEEVLRIRGYSLIPSVLPAVPPPPKLIFPIADLENTVRDLGVNLGFNEVSGRPILDVKELELLEPSKVKAKEVVNLQNSWNEELNCLRSSLLPSLLKYLNSYLKHGMSPVKIMEIGKTYRINKALEGFAKYQEDRMFGLLIDSGFLTLKTYLEKLFLELGVANISYVQTNTSKFRVSAILKVKNEIFGEIGEIKPSILLTEGIRAMVSYCEIDTKKLIKHIGEKKAAVKTEIPNFISEDFTFDLSSDYPIGHLLNSLQTLTPSAVVTYLMTYSKNSRQLATFNLKFRVENAEIDSKNVRLFQKIAGYGVEVVKIESLTKKPDSEKLWLVRTNIGSVVVTGAQNLRLGDVVPFLPVGSTVPTSGEIIKAALIRGSKSEGMLGSGKELGLNEDDQRIFIFEGANKL